MCFRQKEWKRIPVLYRFTRLVTAYRSVIRILSDW